MGKTAIVTGGSSGLGAAIVSRLKSIGYDMVIDWSYPFIDLRSSEDVNNTAQSFCDAYPNRKIDVLINCAGINYINWFEGIPEQIWDSVMDTNVKSIFLVSQALLSRLEGGSIVNVVSNASHIPMTHSAAYNASKGAAHILTLQMARELKKSKNITVFGVSPNKMHSTKMSKYIDSAAARLRNWTDEQAKEYQLAALPAGEETDPKAVAEFIGFLLQDKDHHKFLNGCIMPHGA